MPDADTPPAPDAAPDPSTPGTPSVLELDIERELQDSYLTYAMSTIMDRALPDVRDGLKPSQRRILVSMNDLRLFPGRKHLKCAKICGNTSGDYHPHGESVIYPTLVGMAQRWKMRVPLVDPQGNFGSIDPDPPAAMRYTEARMTPAAMDLLADLKLDTVDFQPNYDERLMEPVVLPGKFPNLLINGSIGIAVGMATSLPPHNPVEVFDAISRVVDDPEIDLASLMQDETDEDGKVLRRGIRGPDFPTGGVIRGRAGIVEAYATGRGRLSVRGTCHVEDLAGGRQQIVIDEIPYSLGQNTLVEKIVECVRDGRIEDVSDVRNESGRSAQSRVVIELKKSADARVVENQLYQYTPLEQTFSVMNIALAGRRPRTLTLKGLIERYIAHRGDVIRRRTAHLLREAQRKAHLVEALIFAVCDLDEVIRLIRASRTREEAIQRLLERRFGIPRDHPRAAKIPARLLDAAAAAEARGGTALTRVQAEHVGSMRLLQLVGLEIERLVGDYASLVAQMEDLEGILADEERVRDIIRADCADMRSRYDSPRLTSIEDAGEEVLSAHLIREEDVAVTISHQGYAKRVPLATYRQQNRGGVGIRASGAKDDDFVEHLFVAGTHDDLLCFTDSGRVFVMKVYEVPELSRESRGRAIVNLLDLRDGERTCAFLAIRDFEAGSNYLTFVSKQGVVKRTALKAYANVHRAGIIAVGLREGDGLLDVLLTTGQDDVIVVTAKGMAIRFAESDAREMGRQAAGVKGIELAPGDEVIGAARIPMLRPGGESDPGQTDPEALAAGLCLLTVTEHGFGKRTPIDEYRVQPVAGPMRSQSRGGKGRADIRTTPRNGPSVAALTVTDRDGVVVLTRGGQLVRMAASSISRYRRGAQGVRVVALREGDAVIAAARAPEASGEGEGPEGEGEPASG
jgi:DNA gyrase subunit A